MSTRRARIALVVVSAAVGLILAEIAVRAVLARPGFEPIPARPSIVPDSVTGYAYAPIALFARPKGGRSLRPVAIQCVQDPSRGPIFIQGSTRATPPIPTSRADFLSRRLR